VKRFAILFALSSAGCGEEPTVPSNVEGTLGGRHLVLGGGGWAWEEPRVETAGGGVVAAYRLRFELTGAAFDPAVLLDAMELAERHDLARRVALADRLSFTLRLIGLGQELNDAGHRYDPSSAEGIVDLRLGVQRPNDEAPGLNKVRPTLIGSDRGWVLVVDEATRPANGKVGRLVGSLELAITRDSQDAPDSLIGNLAIDFDIPLLGNWLGACQVALLAHPEGFTCPS
jgi:hypothetical protein